MTALWPNLQQDFLSILLRFRTFKYTLTADIAQMYRQILIHEAQTQWQTIFWRDDTAEELMTFELKIVTYGTASASFLAVRVMHELANMEISNFLLGSATILNDFYVDDLLTEADSKAEAIQIRNQTIELLKRGAFQLRKWSSNHLDLLKDIPHKSDSEPVHFINYNQEIRTLGIQWNTKDDTFQYTINVADSQRIIKRTMLSILSKIFDPLGLLRPVTLSAKIIIYKGYSIRRFNLGDETIPMHIHTLWSQLLNQIHTLNNFKVRRLVMTSNSSVQIQAWTTLILITVFKISRCTIKNYYITTT